LKLKVMPELPEVETVASGLAKHIVGLKITDVRVNLPKLINLKPALFRKSLLGRRITAVRRRAKVIIIELSRSKRIERIKRNNLNQINRLDQLTEYLVIHLKMSGQLMYLRPADSVQKHTHIIITLSNGRHLRFRDQRQFGYVRFYDRAGFESFLAEHSFGPEPLDGFSLSDFRELLKSRPHSKIKPLLLDQTFIAGIGNLYADEILFYARVHPLKPAGRLKPVEVKDMYVGMQKILRKAIKERGSSVELYVDADGRPGNYVRYIKAYDREGKPCLKCGRKIIRIKIGSRSAYFCPKCQPR